MVSSKLAFVCLFAVFAVVAAEERHDLIIGKLVPGDILIRKYVVWKTYELFKSISITKTYKADGFSKITRVEALDRHDNGHGAKVELVDGGVGYTYVTLRFESENTRGIDFLIKLYVH